MFKPLIKKEEDKEVNSPSNPPSKMISMEDAHQMVEEVAELATQKSMEGFKKYQEQNQQTINTQSLENTEEEINVFNPKTQRAIKNTVQTLKSFNEAFAPPPNPISTAIENKMGEMAADFVASKLGGGVGSTSSKGVISSMLTDVLNTAFGHGLGESLGAGGAESIKTLIMSMGGQSGQGNTKQLSDGNDGKSNQSELSNVEKQKDQVLTLDINNPEHVKNYATAMGLSEKAAKEMLTYHQQDIINERKLSSSSSSNSEMSQVTQALTTLINEMSGMKNTIINLNNEIVNLKSEKIKSPEASNIGISDKWNDENEKITISPESRQVNLFQEPIHVDVDEIRGENLKESFFDNKQSIKEAEIVDKNVENKDNKDNKNNKDKFLEQVIDEKGDSHFRTLDSEDDKKKESDVVETQQSINNNSKMNQEEEKFQEAKQEIEFSNQNQVQRKRIIRKAIVKKEEPIKEEPTKEKFQEIINDEKIVSDEKPVNDEETVTN